MTLKHGRSFYQFVPQGCDWHVRPCEAIGNLSTRRFLGGNGNRKSNVLPIHVSHRQGQPSRLCADFVLPILTSPVEREFCLNDFRAFLSFCLQFLYLVILKYFSIILVLLRSIVKYLHTFFASHVKMATKKMTMTFSCCVK